MNAQVSQDKNLSTESLTFDRARAIPAALFAMLIGTFFIIGVGFASPDTIHNAAHDGRHSIAFPCH